MKKNFSVAGTTQSSPAVESVNNATKLIAQLEEITKSEDTYQGVEELGARVMASLLKLVADHYRIHFDDPDVVCVESIGVDYESRLIECISISGSVTTIFDEDNYNIPEFDEACSKWIPENCDRIYEHMSDIFFDLLPGCPMMQAFENYLAEAWGMQSVKLVNDYGFFSIEVTR